MSREASFKEKVRSDYEKGCMTSSYSDFTAVIEHLITIKIITRL